jgi:hypothetical protein
MTYFCIVLVLVVVLGLGRIERLFEDEADDEDEDDRGARICPCINVRVYLARSAPQMNSAVTFYDFQVASPDYSGKMASFRPRASQAGTVCGPSSVGKSLQEVTGCLSSQARIPSR